METDDHDAPGSVKAKTNAKASAAGKERKVADGSCDEAETVEKGEDKAVTDDEDSVSPAVACTKFNRLILDQVMTAVEEKASQASKHSPAKSKFGGSKKTSGGKRKASSQSDEDSDVTKVDAVQEAQHGNEADDESLELSFPPGNASPQSDRQMQDTPSVKKKSKTSASPKKVSGRSHIHGCANQLRRPREPSVPHPPAQTPRRSVPPLRARSPHRPRRSRLQPAWQSSRP